MLLTQRACHHLLRKPNKCLLDFARLFRVCVVGNYHPCLQTGSANREGGVGSMPPSLPTNTETLCLQTKRSDVYVFTMCV